MKLRLAFCLAAFFASLAPAMAQDSLRGLAPADEYFGHYKLSVLGIANTIRDAGARLDSGGDAHAMLAGPLSYVTDAVKDWEQQYPTDPWLAKDLLALEEVYLRVPTDEGFHYASQTEAWLIADYPDSDQATSAARNSRTIVFRTCRSKCRNKSKPGSRPCRPISRRSKRTSRNIPRSRHMRFRGNGLPQCAADEKLPCGERTAARPGTTVR